MPTFTYDPLTSIGMVRLTIGDTNLTVPGSTAADYTNRHEWTCMYSDEELDALLYKAGAAGVDMASALALYAIAMNRYLTEKYQRINSGPDAVDLGFLAKDLMFRAKQLEDRALYQFADPGDAFITRPGVGSIFDPLRGEDGSFNRY